MRADVIVVASVGDGSQAVPACREHRPDVVLMDYRLPGLDGVQATIAVREACPDTALVLDSTADDPGAPERHPNLRVVPLYVRFGEESFRDYVDLGPEEFYARLRTAPELPTTSQPTPQDFLSTYEELAGYDRILSLQISSKLSGTYQSAQLAAEQAGDDRVRVIDSRTASVAIAMLGNAILRRLE